MIKVSMVKVRFVALPVLFLAVASVGAAVAAEPSYSIEDVQSCSGDAMRLCKDKIPDLDAIQECMRANYNRLHPACKARFNH